MNFNKNDQEKKQQSPKKLYYQQTSSSDSDSDENYQQQHIYKDLHKKIVNESLKHNILPIKMQLVKERQEDDILNIKNYKITKYIKLFGECIQLEEFKYIQGISLVNNNIQPEQFEKLLVNIPIYVKKIKLGNNKLRETGTFNLSLVLQDKEKFSQLKILDIRENYINDQGMKYLSQGLKQLSILYKLNISKNLISDDSAQEISDYLATSSNIKELYMHYNLLSGIGGSCLAEGLSQNKYLVVLDLSYNHLGRGLMECGKKLILSFNDQQYKSLKHVDLTHNSFEYDELKQMGMALNLNNTLYGIHIEGNKNFIVDPRGFLSISEHRFESFLPLIRKSIKGVEKVQNINQFQNYDLNVYDNCWVCEGWVQQKFIFNLKKSSTFISEGPIYLHLDFEKWEPYKMQQDTTNKEVFFCVRMLPPERSVLYFFTAPEQFKIGTQLDQQTSKNSIVKQKFIEIVYDIMDKNNPTKLKTKIQYDSLIRFNIKSVLEGKTIIDNSTYESFIIAKPRQRSSEFSIKEFYQQIIQKQRVAYKKEAQSNYSMCFDQDFKNCEFQKFIKNPDDLMEVKKTIKDNYKKIVNLFKLLASNAGVVDNSFSVSILHIQEFFTECGLFDDKLIKTNDFDINYIATTQSSIKQPLLRYKLLEFLVRIASEKFIRNGLCFTYSQSLNMLLDEGLKKNLNKSEDPQAWRDNHFWNYECDDLILEKSSFLKAIYQYFSGKIRKNNQAFLDTKYISLQEYREIFVFYELLGSTLTERDLIRSFSFSMEPSVDDKQPERKIQLNFEEFTEALARISEYLSMVPFGQDPGNWSTFQRLQQSTFQKYANFIDYLWYFEDIKLQGLTPESFIYQQYKGNEKHALEQTQAVISSVEQKFNRQMQRTISPKHIMMMEIEDQKKKQEEELRNQREIQYKKLRQQGDQNKDLLSPSRIESPNQNGNLKRIDMNSDMTQQQSASMMIMQSSKIKQLKKNATAKSSIFQGKPIIKKVTVKKQYYDDDDNEELETVKINALINKVENEQNLLKLVKSPMLVYKQISSFIINKALPQQLINKTRLLIVLSIITKKLRQFNSLLNVFSNKEQIKKNKMKEQIEKYNSNLNQDDQVNEDTKYFRIPRIRKKNGEPYPSEFREISIFILNICYSPQQKFSYGVLLILLEVFTQKHITLVPKKFPSTGIRAKQVTKDCFQQIGQFLIDNVLMFQSQFSFAKVIMMLSLFTEPRTEQQTSKKLKQNDEKLETYFQIDRNSPYKIPQIDQKRKSLFGTLQN